MVAKTVTWVADDVNAWNGPHGTIYFVNGKFGDGESFSIGAKDEGKALDHLSALKALVDVEDDFTLEDTGKKNNDGETSWKLKGYPGHEYVPYGFNDSAVRPTPTSAAPAAAAALGGMVRSTNDAINRAVALKAAANFAAGRGDSPDVLRVADEFLEWLTADSGPSTVAVAAPEAQPSGAASVVAPVEGASAERISTGAAAPFNPGSEEAGFWSALVFACDGSETKALARVNAVVRPPVERKSLGFVDASDLVKALAKMEESV